MYCIELRDGTITMQLLYHSLIFNFTESVDELTDMVRELFCKIPNKDVLVPVFPDDPYSEDELQVMCV